MLSLSKHLYRSLNQSFDDAVEMLRQAQHDRLIVKIIPFKHLILVTPVILVILSDWRNITRSVREAVEQSSPQQVATRVGFGYSTLPFFNYLAYSELAVEMVSYRSFG